MRISVAPFWLPSKKPPKKPGLDKASLAAYCAWLHRWHWAAAGSRRCLRGLPSAIPPSKLNCS
jgi:hypothetical protein